jgi:CRISPR-associated protein Csc2
MTKKLEDFERFLRQLDDKHPLWEDSVGSKEETYFHPGLKNLGSVSIVLIREVIAPTVFRNAEEEITDIEIGEETYVRAVPNKFKYPEKSRSLQILRAFGVGGTMPQNKLALKEKQPASEAFDLNSLVFGDSTVRKLSGKTVVLPVKAAVNYSDALSVLPKLFCVDKTFHNRAMEDGTLFDAESKSNSDNLFNRHFVKPGTLLVQVLSTRGKVLPLIGLKHLLLSIGFAGTYGGQTSVTGTNIRTHIVGIYGGHFEKKETSPYQIVRTLTKQALSQVETESSQIPLLKKLRQLQENAETGDKEAIKRHRLFHEATALSEHLYETLNPVHEVSMTPQEATSVLEELVNRFEDKKGYQALEQEYNKASEQVADFFVKWFDK